MAEQHGFRMQAPADDVDDRRIAIVGAIVVAVVVASALALIGLRVWLIGTVPGAAGPTVSPRLSQQFPPPRLQRDPQQERADYFAEKQRELSEYGWVDHDRGVVRIPIERAIELLAQPRAGARQSGER